MKRMKDRQQRMRDSTMSACTAFSQPTGGDTGEVTAGTAVPTGWTLLTVGSARQASEMSVLQGLQGLPGKHLTDEPHPHTHWRSLRILKGGRPLHLLELWPLPILPPTFTTLAPFLYNSEKSQNLGSFLPCSLSYSMWLQPLWIYWCLSIQTSCLWPPQVLIA